MGGIFDIIAEETKPEEINQALRSIGGIAEDKTIGVGIKKILLGIETAKQDTDKVGRFVRVINRAIEEERTFT